MVEMITDGSERSPIIDKMNAKVQITDWITLTTRKVLGSNVRLMRWKMHRRSRIRHTTEAPVKELEKAPESPRRYVDSAIDKSRFRGS